MACSRREHRVCRLPAGYRNEREGGGLGSNAARICGAGIGTIGTIGKVANSNPPHASGGCGAQAWSVAKLLRRRARSQVPPLPTQEG